MSTYGDSVTRYKLGVVSDAEYGDDPLCPHCHDRNDMDQHEIIHTIETSKVLGDVMVCADCKGPYLVLEEPQFDEETIFFLDTKLL
jgi:hypothetical protein